MSIITSFEKFRKQLLLDAHPVGSIYTSFNNTDPSKLFGGVWSELPEGYVLRTVERGSRIGPEQFGGSDTLVPANLPKTYIKAEPYTGDLDRVAASLNQQASGGNTVSLADSDTNISNIKARMPNNALIFGEENPQPFVPAHITVYMWKRIG